MGNSRSESSVREDQPPRHCEERSDEAIPKDSPRGSEDCLARAETSLFFVIARSSLFSSSRG